MEAHALAHTIANAKKSRRERLHVGEGNVSDLVAESARMRPVCPDLTGDRLAATGWLRYTAYFGVSKQDGAREGRTPLRMKTCTTISELRAEIQAHKRSGKRIGFVPTMGALHEGHLSLARTLSKHSDVRVCSIFVNPIQFNDPKDYQAYVINLENDKGLLEREGVDLLFAPTVGEIYPSGFQTTVTVNELSKPWEGALRPGHFAGVATVVTILFNAVTPDVAIFGEKDFQQLRLIEQMVCDLKMGIEIVRGDLVRDSDGLALSSRNARLSTEGRLNALSISRGLFAARKAYDEGNRLSEDLEAIVADSVRAVSGAEIEYIAVVDERTLERVSKVDGTSRMLVVARIEGVRLLDNVALSPR